MTHRRARPSESGGVFAPERREPRTGARAVLTLPWLALLVAGLSGPWIYLAAWRVSDGVPGKASDTRPAGGSANVVEMAETGQAGPWGRLEYRMIFTGVPDEWVFHGKILPNRWFFGGMSRAQVAALFESARMDSTQLRELMREEIWEDAPTGTVVKPTDETVLTLGPEPRRTIYTVLSRFDANEAQKSAYTCDAGEVEAWTSDSGLPQPYVDLFKRLLYRVDSMVVMADAGPVLRMMSTHQLRRLFAKLWSRRESVLANLLVPPGTDIEQLTSYWEVGRRQKALGPLLRSLCRLPEGGKLDIVHLLPFLPRRLLYTFPDISGLRLDTAQAKENCYWTALNFWNLKPDDRFVDAASFAQTLRSNFEPVQTPQQLGDLVMVVDGKGEVIHVANYIAADLVFSKNGIEYTQPWTLVRMQKLLAVYRIQFPSEPPLRLAFARTRKQQ